RWALGNGQGPDCNQRGTTPADVLFCSERRTMLSVWRRLYQDLAVAGRPMKSFHDWSAPKRLLAAAARSCKSMVGKVPKREGARRGEGKEAGWARKWRDEEVGGTTRPACHRLPPSVTTYPCLDTQLTFVCAHRKPCVVCSPPASSKSQNQGGSAMLCRAICSLHQVGFLLVRPATRPSFGCCPPSRLPPPSPSAGGVGRRH
ncbi:hypothetical protein MAPG_02386, partial [Magnaporthiopsis poae ATCC 64411]